MANLNDSGNNSLRQNRFTKIFEGFTSQGVEQRLDGKFEHKPYHIEYKLLRLTALITSYFFNGFSALTAAALIFFFVQGLAGTIAAGICTAAAIVLLEMAKRFVGGAFFKQLLQYQKFAGGLFGVLILLTGLSIASSYFGGKQAVQAFSGEAPVIATDSTTAQVSDQIAAIDAQIAELSKQKDRKGTIYFPAQKAIGTLMEQKAVLMPELVRTRVKTDTDNATTTTAHIQTTALKGSHFALVTLLCELLFLLCAYYLEYYDWRTYVELRAKAVTDPAQAVITDPANAVITGSNPGVGFTPQPHAYGTNNRTVISGFQPHSNQPTQARYNSPVITDPLITDDPPQQPEDAVITAQDKPNLAPGERACLHCQKTYTPKTWNQKFCSNKGNDNCKDAYHAAQHGGTLFNPALHHNQKS